MLVPIYFNIVNGELAILYTVVPFISATQGGCHHIQIKHELIGKIKLSKYKNLHLMVELTKIEENVIYPANSIGMLGEIWIFIGYYDKLNDIIIENNMMREEVSINEFYEKNKHKIIQNKIEIFQKLESEKNDFSEDIIQLITSKINGRYNNIPGLIEY